MFYQVTDSYDPVKLTGITKLCKHARQSTRPAKADIPGIGIGYVRPTIDDSAINKDLPSTCITSTAYGPPHADLPAVNVRTRISPMI